MPENYLVIHKFVNPKHTSTPDKIILPACLAIPFKCLRYGYGKKGDLIFYPHECEFVPCEDSTTFGLILEKPNDKWRRWVAEEYNEWRYALDVGNISASTTFMHWMADRKPPFEEF